jgi:hypothetical protein
VRSSSKPARQKNNPFTYEESRAIYYGFVNMGRKWVEIKERNQNALRNRTATQIRQRHATMVKNNWMPNEDENDESNEQENE